MNRLPRGDTASIRPGCSRCPLRRVDRRPDSTTSARHQWAQPRATAAGRKRGRADRIAHRARSPAPRAKLRYGSPDREPPQREVRLRQRSCVGQNKPTPVSLSSATAADSHASIPCPAPSSPGQRHERMAFAFAVFCHGDSIVAEPCGFDTKTFSGRAVEVHQPCPQPVPIIGRPRCDFDDGVQRRIARVRCPGGRAGRIFV